MTIKKRKKLPTQLVVQGRFLKSMEGGHKEMPTEFFY